MHELKLLSEPTNYAVVHLPGRAFPGVVFQGDSLHGLIVDLRAALVETDSNEREFTLREMIERLSGVQNNYERVLIREGISLSYQVGGDKIAQVAEVIASNVIYTNQNDERAFFEWLERMPFVSNFYGVVRDLFIEFGRVPTDSDLWDIIGFFKRYGIDLKQLEQFMTDENRHWLADVIG